MKIKVILTIILTSLVWGQPVFRDWPSWAEEEVYSFNNGAPIRAYLKKRKKSVINCLYYYPYKKEYKCFVKRGKKFKQVMLEADEIETSFDIVKPFETSMVEKYSEYLGINYGYGPDVYVHFRDSTKLQFFNLREPRAAKPYLEMVVGLNFNYGANVIPISKLVEKDNKLYLYTKGFHKNKKKVIAIIHLDSKIKIFGKSNRKYLNHNIYDKVINIKKFNGYNYFDIKDSNVKIKSCPSNGCKTIYNLKRADFTGLIYHRSSNYCLTPDEGGLKHFKFKDKTGNFVRSYARRTWSLVEYKGQFGWISNVKGKYFTGKKAEWPGDIANTDLDGDWSAITKVLDENRACIYHPKTKPWKSKFYRIIKGVYIYKGPVARLNEERQEKIQLMNRNDILEVLEKDVKKPTEEDADFFRRVGLGMWYKVKNKQGKVGYIHSGYIVPID